jgi:hypothetical protein
MFHLKEEREEEGGGGEGWKGERDGETRDEEREGGGKGRVGREEKESILGEKERESEGRTNEHMHVLQRHCTYCILVSIALCSVHYKNVLYGTQHVRVLNCCNILYLDGIT